MPQLLSIMASIVRLCGAIASAQAAHYARTILLAGSPSLINHLYLWPRHTNDSHRRAGCRVSLRVHLKMFVTRLARVRLYGAPATQMARSSGAEFPIRGLCGCARVGCTQLPQQMLSRPHTHTQFLLLIPTPHKERLSFRVD